MFRKTSVFLVILFTALSLSSAGCRQKVGGISCNLDSSKIVAGYNLGWHDINLTNNSGHDLHEVRVVLTITGEDGVPRSHQKYYAAWPNGRTVEVSLSRADSPVNVQKISLNGTCDEGDIDFTWTPSKP